MAYTKKQRDKAIKEICKRVANDESIREILKSPHLPSKDTFYRWLTENPVYQEHYVRACHILADMDVSEIKEIVDDAEQDTVDDGKGGKRANTAAVARARLRMDARIWLASVRNKRKYGTKVDVTSGDKPIVTAPVVLKVDGKDIGEELKL